MGIQHAGKLVRSLLFNKQVFKESAFTRLACELLAKQPGAKADSR